MNPFRKHRPETGPRGRLAFRVSIAAAYENWPPLDDEEVQIKGGERAWRRFLRKASVHDLGIAEDCLSLYVESEPIEDVRARATALAAARSFPEIALQEVRTEIVPAGPLPWLLFLLDAPAHKLLDACEALESA